MKAPRSVRSFQREIKKLKDIIAMMQWVQPVYNGSHSCSACGNMRHWGCEEDCPAAAITGNYGKKEV